MKELKEARVFKPNSVAHPFAYFTRNRWFSRNCGVRIADE